MVGGWPAWLCWPGTTSPQPPLLTIPRPVASNHHPPPALICAEVTTCPNITCTASHYVSMYLVSVHLCNTAFVSHSSCSRPLPCCPAAVSSPGRAGNILLLLLLAGGWCGMVTGEGDTAPDLIRFPGCCWARQLAGDTDHWDTEQCQVPTTTTTQHMDPRTPAS